MTASDPVLSRLHGLRVLEPDAARAGRVRERCRTLMTRGQPQGGVVRSRGFAVLVLEPALVGGLCLSYLFAVVHDVLRLYGGR
jgi:hypothetical protein